MPLLLETATAIGRTGVGAILLVAGCTKIRAGGSLFLNAILGYDLVPHSVATRMARWLPRVEVALGALLVLGVLTRLAENLAFALICVMAVAVVTSLVRGRKNHCGCLGFTAERVQEVQWQLVYRNLALLGLLVADAAWEAPVGPLSWLFPAAPTSLPAAGAGPLAVALACVAAAAGAARWYSFMRDSQRSLSVPRLQ
jgi:uncharacterized membrane protein YphA (DoxX/SURF4 family)